MKRKKLVFLLVLWLVYLGLSFAQVPIDIVDPLAIDIYTFDAGLGVNTKPEQYLSQANSAYSSQDYETAAKYYLAHLKATPEDSNSWYNLSCCYGLLGHAELAAKYLQHAYKKGFQDIDHILNDSDFASVKQSESFAATLDSLQVWSAKLEHYQGKMEYFPLQQYIPYRLHIPENYNPDKEYTLVIGLHGFGDRAEKFAGLWRAMEHEDIIFVVPEAPYSFPSEEMRGFSWSPFVSRTSSVSNQAFMDNAAYIINLSKHIQKQYNIKQKWLFGFSQGAYTSLILALKNPKEFDGVVACGGGLETSVITDKDYKKAKNVNFLLSHGLQDKVVPYDESERARMVLSQNGNTVTLHSFEGAHSISRDVFPYLFKALQK